MRWRRRKFTGKDLRELILECATVVRDTETLVVRVPVDYSPVLAAEYQKAMTNLDLPFKVLVVPAKELGIVSQSDSEFDWRVIESINRIHVRSQRNGDVLAARKLLDNGEWWPPGDEHHD